MQDGGNVMERVYRWYYEHKKYIKYILCGVVMVLGIVYAVHIVNYNKTERKMVFKDYDMNETFEFRGANYTFLDRMIVTVEEMLDMYGLEESDLPADDSLNDDAKLVIARYEVEKISDDGMGAAFDSVMLYTLTSGVYYNFELFITICPDYIGVPMMEVGDKQVVDIPFLLTERSFDKKAWNNLEDEQMYLMFDDVRGREYLTRVYLN